MSIVDNEKLLEFGVDLLSDMDSSYASTSTFTAGSKGLVPAPTASDIENGYILKADGTWGDFEGGLNIVTWAQGSYQEIAKMVAAADGGKIDLKDYWSVGDERAVRLSAMDAIGVNDSHVSQYVTFVLMDIDNPNYEYVTPPSSGETHCRFIVGMKDGLANYQTGETGYMNSSNTNDGGWSATARRTWCNNTFRNAIPSTLRPIFKQVKVKAMNGGNQSGTTLITSNDYFFLPAEKEIFGSNRFSADTEVNALTQWQYYTNSANRIKKQGDIGSDYQWWERSAYYNNKKEFCSVSNSGSYYANSANSNYLIAPCGCI